MPLDQVQLIPTLRARWLQVLLIWAAVLAAVAAVSMALPPRYEATASVMVEMGGTDPIGGQAVFKPAGAVSTFLATQHEILRSEQVARGAVRSLGLQEKPEWLQAWREKTGGHGELEPWLAGQLLRNIAVRPSRDSNVLNLSFTSQAPEFSSAVANAFVSAYVDTTLQMQVRPAQQFNAFFEERAKLLREALEHARARLSAYEREHGVIVSDERDVEADRLAALTSQLVVLQNELADSTNRRRQAAATPTDMGDLRGDPEVQALTKELAQQEARLSELRSGLGERHPAVVETRQAVTELRQRIDASMQRAARTYETSSRVTRARLGDLQAAIDRQRTLVHERKFRRDAAAVLVRDVDNAQKAYDAVLNRASQTALEGANTTQPSIAILKSATPPPAPSSSLMLNLSVAALLGLLLGIARALFAERRDRRLRTIDDVTHLLRQPLLLALPDARTGRLKPDRRSAETRRRLVPVQRRLLAPR
jgi:polysaccharide biosynthesis transport protein